MTRYNRRIYLACEEAKPAALTSFKRPLAIKSFLLFNIGAAYKGF